MAKEDSDDSTNIPIARATRGEAGIFKANLKYALAIATCDVEVPRYAKYALIIPHWKEAIANEFKALQENETWTLVPRQSEDNMISTKWVFKLKSKDDDLVERFKACLVANQMR